MLSVLLTIMAASTASSVNAVLVADWTLSTRLSVAEGSPAIITVERQVVTQLPVLDEQTHWDILLAGESVVELPSSVAASSRTERDAFLARPASGLDGSLPAAIARAHAILEARDPQGSTPRLVLLLTDHHRLPRSRAFCHEPHWLDPIEQEAALCELADSKIPTMTVVLTTEEEMALPPLVFRDATVVSIDAASALRAILGAVREVRAGNLPLLSAATCATAKAHRGMKVLTLPKSVHRGGHGDELVLGTRVELKAQPYDLPPMCQLPTVAQWQAAAKNPNFVRSGSPELVRPGASESPNQPLTIQPTAETPGYRVVSGPVPHDHVERCSFCGLREELNLTGTQIAMRVRTPLFDKAADSANAVGTLPLFAELRGVDVPPWVWVQAEEGHSPEGWVRKFDIFGGDAPPVVNNAFAAVLDDDSAANTGRLAKAWESTGAAGAQEANALRALLKTRTPYEEAMSPLPVAIREPARALQQVLGGPARDADAVCAAVVRRKKVADALRDTPMARGPVDGSPLHVALRAMPVFRVCSIKGRDFYVPTYAKLANYARDVPGASAPLRAMANQESGCGVAWMRLGARSEQPCLDAAGLVQELQELAQAWPKAPPCLREVLVESVRRAVSAMSQQPCWCGDYNSVLEAGRKFYAMWSQFVGAGLQYAPQAIDEMLKDPQTRYNCRYQEGARLDRTG